MCCDVELGLLIGAHNKVLLRLQYMQTVVFRTGVVIQAFIFLAKYSSTGNLVVSGLYFLIRARAVLLCNSRV